MTTHVERRGLYTWANQMIFGNVDSIVSSKKPIYANLPVIGTKKHSPSSNQDGKHFLNGMLVHSKPATLDDEDGHSSEAEYTEESIEISLDHSDHTSSSDEGESDDQEEDAVNKVSERDENILSGKQPVAPEMITLSMLPRSQWLNLVHIDTIKSRNKPIEPPKKPEAAPFFLPTIAGANAGRDPVFAPVSEEDKHRIAAAAQAAWDEEDEEEDEDAQEKSTSRISRAKEDVRSLEVPNTFLQLLHEFGETSDHKPLLGYLKQMPPSAVDVELRSLELIETSTDVEVANLALHLKFLEAAISSEEDFEFLQALLRATILLHGDSIPSHPSLVTVAAQIEASTNLAWGRIASLIQHSQCLLGILGSMHA